MLRCLATRAAVFCAVVASWAAASHAQDTLFQYDSDSSGYWHEGSNWDQGTAPNGTNDLVLIDRPSASPTITFSAASGTRLVKSLTSEESLVLSGGLLRSADERPGSMEPSPSRGGTLKGGVITANSGIDVTSSGDNGVDGITLNGDLQLLSGGDYLQALNGVDAERDGESRRAAERRWTSRGRRPSGRAPARRRRSRWRRSTPSCG